jgi:hypothetical protein
MPGLCIIFVIEYASGGSKAMIDNLRFTGDCEMYKTLQFMMSMLDFLCIGYTYYLFRKDKTLLNIFDYFDFYFMIFARMVVISSKYALFPPQLMMFLKETKLTTD